MKILKSILIPFVAILFILGITLSFAGMFFLNIVENFMDWFMKK